MVRLAAFYRILAGQHSNIDELALQTGITANRVQQCIKDMADQRILVLDEQGTVVGSHGLSIIPTEHRLSIGGRNLFTWCAADAVGIPTTLVDAVKLGHYWWADVKAEGSLLSTFF